MVSRATRAVIKQDYLKPEAQWCWSSSASWRQSDWTFSQKPHEQG
jgi:hypothetical protein